MQYILLTIRYIPFWAIPLIFICGQFIYIFWLKNMRGVAYMFGGIIFFCIISLSYYVLLGGAEKAVHHAQNLIF
tara:strand:+ start:152 stop:373 length:222 start_codon:yes stop_codon:yes gene_type:complete